MLVSRRRFVHVAGGLASALATLPLAAEAWRSPEPAKEITVSGPVRLDSNENPYGPSAKVLESMREALTTANRYPRSEYAPLVQRIAALHNVAPERVLVGCGSSESSG